MQYCFNLHANNNIKPYKISPVKGDFLYNNGLCFIHDGSFMTYDIQLLNKYSQEFLREKENLLIKRVNIESNLLNYNAGLILISYLLDTVKLSYLEENIKILNSGNKNEIQKALDKTIHTWIRNNVKDKRTELNQLSLFISNHNYQTYQQDTFLPILVILDDSFCILSINSADFKSNININPYIPPKSEASFDSLSINNEIIGEYIDQLFSRNGYYFKSILALNYSYGSNWLYKSLHYYSEQNKYAELKNLLDRKYLNLLNLDSEANKLENLYISFIEENYYINYSESSIYRSKYILSKKNYFRKSIVRYSNTFFRLALYNGSNIHNIWIDSVNELIKNQFNIKQVEINDFVLNQLNNVNKKFSYQTYLENEFYCLFLDSSMSRLHGKISASIRNNNWNQYTLDSSELSDEQRWNLYLMKIYFNKDQSKNPINFQKDISIESLQQHIANYNLIFPSKDIYHAKKKNLDLCAYYIVWQLNFNKNKIDSANIFHIISRNLVEYNDIRYHRSYHILNCLKTIFAKNRVDTMAPLLVIFNKSEHDNNDIFISNESNINFNGAIFDASNVNYLKINNIDVKIENNCFSHVVFLNSGKNYIVFEFEDVFGNRKSITKQVVYESDKDKFSSKRSFALIFAVSDYEFNSEWKDLKNPILDAEYFANSISNYGFDTIIYRNPTKQMFYNAISKYSEILKSRGNQFDQLIIFFTGHGDYDSRSNQGFLVLKDSKTYGERFHRESYVSIDDVVIKLNRSSTNNVLFLIDACHSGLVALNNATVTPSTKDKQKNTSYLIDKLSSKCRKFISSVGNIESYDGLPGEHSPFIKKIVACLDNNKEKTISFEKIISYIQLQKTSVNIARDKTKEVESDDLPQFGSFGDEDSGSTFIFIRTRT